MSNQSPEAWFKAMPLLTRYGLATIFCLTLLVQLEVVNPQLLIYQWPFIYQKLQIWRLITACVFFGGFSFPFVFQMYFFTSFSSKLENNEIFQESGDYLFFLLLMIFGVGFFGLIISWPMGIPVLGPSWVYAIIYYWSRREPYSNLSFFSFSIKAYQFPFCLMFVQMIMGGSIWGDIVGLAAAHSYYFIKEVVPMEYGYTLIKTPKLLNTLMAPYVPKTGSNTPAAPTTFGGGAGNRLGD